MNNRLKHERMLDCRYYNGEEKPPDHEFALFWDYERGWVNGKYEQWDTEKRDLKRLGLENFEPNDGTQYDFKCLLFNRYYHWNYGCEPMEFLSWYRNQYQKPRQTNRQRRYLSRKEKLLKSCRFYNGEEVCQYHDDNDIHFWKYEKIWVERLSSSYKHAENWRSELMPYKKIQDFVKKHNLSSSYIGLLINRDLHWIGIIDETDFLASLEQNYLKLKK